MEKATTVGSSCAMDSNPDYLAISHSPGLFVCESDSESDDGYVNDDTEIFNLRKLMVSPQENDYIEIESTSSFPKCDYENMKDYERDYCNLCST